MLKTLSSILTPTIPAIGAFLLWRGHVLNRSSREKDFQIKLSDLAKEHDTKESQEITRDQIANLLSLYWNKDVDPNCYLHLHRQRLLRLGRRFLKSAGHLVIYCPIASRIIDKSSAFERYRKRFRICGIAYAIASIQYLLIFVPIRLIAPSGLAYGIVAASSLLVFGLTLGMTLFVASRFHALHFLITEQPYRFRFRQPTGLPAPVL